MRRAPASLRRRLIREAVPSLVLVWLVASAFILMRSWDEIEESYVDQIEQLAHTTAEVLDARAISPEAVIESVHARRDRNIFVIVEREGAPILRSATAPPGLVEVPPESDGTAEFYLAQADAQDGTIRVITGIRRIEVRQLTAAIAGGAALPLALGLIAMIAVLVLAISRALRPLEALREALEARHPDALDPVASGGLPAELVPMVRALNHLLGRLGQAVEAERRFVADASHELRTPLAAIRAQVETIDHSRLDAEDRAALEQVMRGVERSTRLAQQLLRLARADAAGSGETPELDLAAEVTGIVSELFPLAVRLDREIEADCAPAMVRAFPADLEMLVGNLVENAIHHGAGPIRISCGPQGVAGQGVAEQDVIGQGGAWLCVEDAGPGIPETERAALFQRFRRGAGATSEGAGLGLSIVASVAARIPAEVRLSRAADLGGLHAEVVFHQGRRASGSAGAGPRDLTA